MAISSASTIASVASTGITVRNVTVGEAHVGDAFVGGTTTALGGVFGTTFMGTIGIGIGVIQRIYDWWAGVR